MVAFLSLCLSILLFLSLLQRCCLPRTRSELGPLNIPVLTIHSDSNIYDI